MKRTMVAAVSCIALAASAIPQTASAARYHDQEQFMGNWCDSHPGDSDCNDWHHHRGHWNEARYHDWYGRHRDDFGPADTAATVFGFAAGTAAGLITGAINGATQPACVNFRSYDPADDTYRGRDGYRHHCH